MDAKAAARAELDAERLAGLWSDPDLDAPDLETAGEVASDEDQA